MDRMDDDLLTTGQSARAAGVSVVTVERWVDSDQLPAIRLSAGYRLIRRRDLDEFLRLRQQGLARGRGSRR